MVFFCILLLSFAQINLGSQANSDFTSIEVVQNDSLSAASIDSLSKSPFDSLSQLTTQSPSIGYIIEKHSIRAIKAAKETLSSLHVQGRFPIHIILFVICFSLVLITSVDVVKNKSKNTK